MILRLLAGLIATALLVIGVVALTGTVTMDDAWRATFDCGSAVNPDSREAIYFGTADDYFKTLTGAPARSTSSVTTYTAACRDAVTGRRLWAWPLTGLGVLGVLGALLARRRRSTT
ncbi:hypothetical protein [Amycolatopsis sp.]|uniref:hypothetical protein n=1 Tax=Amycolatopsis sp. TaxID=37632 RepID=UPI002DFCEE4E|nr:hypothetical protein [Amycolatopsis sp.]